MNIEPKRIQKGEKPNQAGFSLVEILIVVGIIGILAGMGTVNYMSQISQNRVENAVRVIEAKCKQARQMSIALREKRRVAIDVGEVDSSGARVFPARIWIEAKRCEDYLFEEPPLCLDNAGATSNVYEVDDADFIPDGVSIADVDGIIPEETGVQIFYIEFNARGAVSKVYFTGEESNTLPNQIAPILHLTQDNERILHNNDPQEYSDVIDHANSSQYQFDNGENAKERYKVHTLEIIRLTGRTRSYDYAVLNPWPLDNPTP